MARPTVLANRFTPREVTGAGDNPLNLATFAATYPWADGFVVAGPPKDYEDYHEAAKTVLIGNTMPVTYKMNRWMSTAGDTVYDYERKYNSWRLIREMWKTGDRIVISAAKGAENWVLSSAAANLWEWSGRILRAIETCMRYTAIPASAFYLGPGFPGGYVTGLTNATIAQCQWWLTRHLVDMGCGVVHTGWGDSSAWTDYLAWVAAGSDPSAFTADIFKYAQVMAADQGQRVLQPGQSYYQYKNEANEADSGAYFDTMCDLAHDSVLAHTGVLELFRYTVAQRQYIATTLDAVWPP